MVLSQTKNLLGALWLSQKRGDHLESPKASLGAGTAPYTPLGCCMAASCPCCHALDPAASWFRKLAALLAFFSLFSPLLLLLGLFAWARASPRSGFPRGEASAAGDGRVTRTGRWHQHPVTGAGRGGIFLPSCVISGYFLSLSLFSPLFFYFTVDARAKSPRYLLGFPAARAAAAVFKRCSSIPRGVCLEN